MIGSGRYVLTGPGRAGVAFIVEEDYHGRGIASRLLRHLAIVVARAITAFATFRKPKVLAANQAMRAVFQRTGMADAVAGARGGTLHITLALPDDPLRDFRLGAAR